MSSFFFDLEAGGLSGHQSSILSIAYGRSTSNVEALYASPVERSRLYKWSAKNVWNPIQSSGVSLQTEKRIIQGFIDNIQNMKAKGVTELSGWNIGYVPYKTDPTEQRLRGFDLPMLATRAEKYGLGNQLRSAIQGLAIRDVGAEYSVIAARTALLNQGKVEESIYEQAVGMKKALAAENIDIFDPTQLQAAARKSSVSGIKFAGWKQELMYDIMFPTRGGYQSHFAQADVQAGLELSNIPQDKVQATLQSNISKWNVGVVRNKILSSLRYGVGANRQFESMDQLWAKARQYGIQEDIEKGIQTIASDYEADIGDIRLGKGIGAEKYTRQTALGIQQSTDSFYKNILTESAEMVVKNKWKAAAVGAVGLGLILQPGQLFSGKDDNYNIIEGLRHEGFAGRLRRENTDFGSGWVRRAISAGVSQEHALGPPFVRIPCRCRPRDRQIDRQAYGVLSLSPRRRS